MNIPLPAFLSVILPVRNKKEILPSLLDELTQKLSHNVSDYELIIIDNASDDDTIEQLKFLTSSDGLPNLQVYTLTKEVNLETAVHVGLENALGDFVLIYNPDVDSVSVLPEMLETALSGHDVVFAKNHYKIPTKLSYRLFHKLFYSFYQWVGGVNLVKEAPQYRLLSKRVVNFILQHNQPAISYRHLPATAGFSKAYIEYQSKPQHLPVYSFRKSVARSVRFMISTTQAPMRFATLLLLFGATANVLYSVYVVLAAVFLDNIAPGWVSTSLQASGMFFLISLVLLVLSEYILNITQLVSSDPQYYISQELTSAKMTKLEKLNIEEISTSHPKTQ